MEGLREDMLRPPARIGAGVQADALEGLPVVAEAFDLDVIDGDLVTVPVDVNAACEVVDVKGAQPQRRVRLHDSAGQIVGLRGLVESGHMVADDALEDGVHVHSGPPIVGMELARA